MGKVHGDNRGHTLGRQACWPHEPCYLGYFNMVINITDAPGVYKTTLPYVLTGEIMESFVYTGIRRESNHLNKHCTVLCYHKSIKLQTSFIHVSLSLTGHSWLPHIQVNFLQHSAKLKKETRICKRSYLHKIVFIMSISEFHTHVIKCIWFSTSLYIWFNLGAGPSKANWGIIVHSRSP